MHTKHHHHLLKYLLFVLLVLIVLFIPKSINGVEYYDMPEDGIYNYRYLDEIVGSPVLGELIVLEGKITGVLDEATLIVSDGYTEIKVKINALYDSLPLLNRLGEQLYVFGTVQMNQNDVLVNAAEITTSDGEVFSIKYSTEEE